MDLRKLSGILALCLASACGSRISEGPIDAPDEGSVDAEAARAEAVLGRAKVWRPGEEIPRLLLEDRSRKGCLPELSETSTLYQSIDNLPLLLAVIERPEAQPGSVDHALARALQLRGPSEVFGKLDRDHLPERVKALANEPKVWVAASAVMDEAGVPSGEAWKVIRRLAARVRDGERFEDAYRALFEHHATLTNTGDFVLSQSHPSAMPLRDVEVPADTVASLLEANGGDLVLVKEPVPHHGFRAAVYEVREVWPGAPKPDSN